MFYISVELSSFQALSSNYLWTSWLLHVEVKINFTIKVVLSAFFTISYHHPWYLLKFESPVKYHWIFNFALMHDYCPCFTDQETKPQNVKLLNFYRFLGNSTLSSVVLDLTLHLTLYVVIDKCQSYDVLESTLNTSLMNTSCSYPSKG